MDIFIIRFISLHSNYILIQNTQLIQVVGIVGVDLVVVAKGKFYFLKNIELLCLKILAFSDLFILFIIAFGHYNHFFIFFNGINIYSSCILVSFVQQQECLTTMS